MTEENGDFFIRGIHFLTSSACIEIDVELRGKGITLIGIEVDYYKISDSFKINLPSNFSPSTLHSRECIEFENNHTLFLMCQDLENQIRKIKWLMQLFLDIHEQIVWNNTQEES